MRAHSLVMALYQDQNMSESSMGHYFENARFRRRQGQSRTLKMQLKLTQTQVFYKKNTFNKDQWPLYGLISKPKYVTESKGESASKMDLQ